MMPKDTAVSRAAIRLNAVVVAVRLGPGRTIVNMVYSLIPYLHNMQAVLRMYIHYTCIYLYLKHGCMSEFVETLYNSIDPSYI